MIKLVIVFIFLSVPVLLSLPLNPTEEFKKEIDEISVMLNTKNITTIQRLKESMEDYFSQVKSFEPSNYTDIILSKIENAYKILQEVDGPNDIDKLRIFKNELKKINEMIVEIILTAIKSMDIKLDLSEIGRRIKAGWDEFTCSVSRKIAMAYLRQWADDYKASETASRKNWQRLGTFLDQS